MGSSTQHLETAIAHLIEAARERDLEAALKLIERYLKQGRLGLRRCSIDLVSEDNVRGPLLKSILPHAVSDSALP